MFTSLNNKTKNAIVAYATSSGNAQLVAEALSDGLNEAGVNVNVKRAELTNGNELKDFDLIVLVCSTWDVGDLNPNFVELNNEMKNIDLSNNYVDIIGLGDSEHYDVFCGAADIIETTVKGTNAKSLMPTLRIDGDVYLILKDIKKRGVELGKMI